MKRTNEQLRRDALQIWQAGLDRVRADRLVRETLCVEGHWLTVGPHRIDLRTTGRIAVVGAGKAGAAMAAGLEEALGPLLLADKQVGGWVNVPADCVRPLARIHIHAARPAGVNEPTDEAVAGSEQILRLVGTLGPDDLCLALLSGGGSALLPAPAEGVSITDKLAVTRHLSAAGATIHELNAVRKQLSRIKGGGLARACRAGRLVALIISDVPGDRLDVIASGPTVPDESTPAEALAVLERYAAREAHVPEAVFAAIQRAKPAPSSPTCHVDNLIIGNNSMAVEAAAGEAERLGYWCAAVVAGAPEGPAEELGRRLAGVAVRLRDGPGPDCVVSGGEPVVKLADAAVRGRGGRNQQLVLAAMQQLQAVGGQGIVLLSGGTDGEDGPTDAAGALCDPNMLSAAQRESLDLADCLRRNDAYTCFDQFCALIRTGPTGTNVGDLRVVVVERRERARATTCDVA